MPVYIVGTSQDAETVKIGWAKDVSARLKGLQTSHPERLRVLRVIDCDFGGERWMHDRYGHLRLNGEWFSTDPEMFVVIVPQRLSAASKIIAEMQAKPTGANSRPWLYPLDAIGKLDTNVVGHHFDYYVGRWVPGVVDDRPSRALERFGEHVKRCADDAAKLGVSVNQLADALRGVADLLDAETLLTTQAAA